MENTFKKNENLVFLNSSKEIYQKILFDMTHVNHGHMYPVDLFFLGVSNRSLSLIAGFSLLIANNNALTAISLIRLHLDNLLQLYAVFLVSNPDKLVLNVMKGKKRIKDHKDKDGKFLSGNYLVKSFFNDPENKEFLGLKEVYKETSKFIHFSNKHIFSIIVSSNKDNKYTCLISEASEIPKGKKDEIIECMVQITRAQFKYLIGWVETKKRQKHAK